MPDAESPPTLFSDVLGAMVSGIAQARQIADVAAVNLAYAYQRHELLRGMAVPRLRFRSIDVNLPVLIQRVHGAKKPVLDEAPAIARRVAAEVQRRADLAAQKLRFELRMEDLSPEKQAWAEAELRFWEQAAREDTCLELCKAAADQLERRVLRYFAGGVESPAAGTEAATRVEAARAVRASVKAVFRDILSGTADLLSAETLDLIAPLRSESSRRYSLDELRQSPTYHKILEAATRLASDTCFRTPSVPAELEMVICTDDIKNKGGGADSLAHIRFTLLEEGLEWVEDEQGRRLIVE